MDRRPEGRDDGYLVEFTRSAHGLWQPAMCWISQPAGKPVKCSLGCCRDRLKTRAAAFVVVGLILRHQAWHQSDGIAHLGCFV